MKFTYEPYNNAFFAANLRKSRERLKWDTNNGGATLIIQGRFGEDVETFIEKICEKLSKMESTFKEGFVSLAPDYPYIFARLLSAQQKAREGGGCLIKSEGSRYTILAAKISGEECVVYEPRGRHILDIPVELSIAYTKVYDQIKTFITRRVREEFAGFYEVSFEKGVPASYRNGDIYYTMNGVNIPITNEMIKAGRFYIKTEEMPTLETKSEGFSILVREIQ